MNFRYSQNSFSRGELSPVLHYRTDLKQYAIGLKTLKNGFVHQEGCVSNRAGTEFVGATVYNNKYTRLIPFVFNSDQTYIIEAGEYYFKFIRNGGYIVYPTGHQHAGEHVTVGTPYTEDDLKTLKYAQNGDILTLTCINRITRELIRNSNYSWELNTINIGSSISAPTNVQATWSTTTPTEHTRTYSYRVTAVDKNTMDESTGSSVASATGHREGNWTTDEYMTISWDKVDNAEEYNIYRNVNGIYGYIGTAKGNGSTISFRDDNIEPDLSETLPINKNPFGNGEYPSCCCYFQQRKVYANTQNKPQTVFASQLSSENNFNISRPILASDSIEIPLADREVNEIRHLIPFKDLIILTSHSEYKMNGSDGVFQANPMPIAVIQSCYGSSHVQPIVSGDMLVFVENGGNVLRDFGYDYLSDAYKGDELSLLASHLFEGKKIVDIAYANTPYRIIYVVMNDGSMATLTYNKRQEICGWARYETDGYVKAVATVHEGNEDVAYFIIERIITPQYEGGYKYIGWEDVKYTENNVTIEFTAQKFTLDDDVVYYSSSRNLAVGSKLYTNNKLTQNEKTVTSLRNGKITLNGDIRQYVERTKSRVINDAINTFMVDCGLSIVSDDNPVSHLSGLNHLRNRKVVVLADGAVIDDLKVQQVKVSSNPDVYDGVLDIGKPAKRIVVGLPYEFEFETLGIEAENTQGLLKIINSVNLQVYKSREDFWVVGNKGTEYKNNRSHLSVDNNAYLYSGGLTFTPLNTATEQATVHIKQKHPLPLTITAVSSIVNIADVQDTQ